MDHIPVLTFLQDMCMELSWTKFLCWLCATPGMSLLPLHSGAIKSTSRYVYMVKYQMHVQTCVRRMDHKPLLVVYICLASIAFSA